MTRSIIPYDLARYAKYPRRSASSESVSSSVDTDRGSTPPPKIPLSPHFVGEVHSTSATTLDAIPEHDVFRGHILTAIDGGPLGGTGTYDLVPRATACSGASSICSFKTAKEATADGPGNGSELGRGVSSSNSAAPSTAMVLHSDPDDCFPTDRYSPSVMVVGLPEHRPSVGTAQGIGTSNNSPRMNIVVSTHTDVSTSSAVAHNQRVAQQEPKKPPPPKQPTMLLFIIQGTRNNYQISKCEYIVRYKTSRDNPNFPNCLAKEGVFLFDDLCPFKAVVDRMRIWHRQNPFKAKDMRVEDCKYYMSYRERVELRDWNWPGYISKEWARCLIWDAEFPEPE
ncbi:hypothetical protein Dda_3476 [Drechslerella dactyloides]|uniref:Uncharacterized protein n=1 Tax=Drechslerella dactyloides TaxID=74499 RepID=A0AAD6J1B9_DREDA|nr:hypothetical protein Dda_3476 [Drechslerella dactyloides]